jgi:hypothetical protein
MNFGNVASLHLPRRGILLRDGVSTNWNSVEKLNTWRNITQRVEKELASEVLIIFWDTTQFDFIEVPGRFGRTLYLHLKGWRICQEYKESHSFSKNGCFILGHVRINRNKMIVRDSSCRLY